VRLSSEVDDVEGQHIAGTGVSTEGSDASSSPNEEYRLIQALFEYSSEVICVLTPEGGIRYLSPSSKKVLGYVPDELMGSPAFELIHPDDVDSAVEAIRRGVAAPGEPQETEVRIRHKNQRWLVMGARGIAHTESGSTRVVVILSDVSERKRAEKALSASEERFRSTFQNTAIGKILWQVDGRVERANRAVLDLLGYSEAEFLGLNWRDQCHPDDLEALEHSVRELFSGRTPSVQLVVRTRHHDGPMIWVRATLAVVRDGDGTVRHVIGELDDITEQRLAEEEKRARLLRIERQQSAIVSVATHEAVVSGDLQTALSAITEAAAAAMDVGRVAVWLFNDDRTELRCADLFERAANRHSEGQLLSGTTYQKYFEALESDRVIDADDAVTDPRTSELAKEHLTPTGISSRLDAPIRIAGRVVGVVCHDHMDEPRIWQADELKFAGEVSDQVAHALASAQRSVAERRLQDSEARFRSIVNSSPMGLLLYRLDDENRLIFSGSNPAADSILGVDCRQYMGKTIEEAFPPLAETEIPERYREAAADGIPWNTEQVIYEDDQINGAYEVHAFQSAPSTVTVLFLDITARRQANDSLRESELRYRTLFERNLAGVYRSTADGRMLACNRALAGILGFSSAEKVLAHDASDFYPSPEDRDRLLEMISRGAELRNHEMQLRRADGSLVWVLANMSLLPSENGEPAVIEGTMIDITERKQAEDRLLLQSTALESAANAIVITDPEGTIGWANRAFGDLTGYSASEAVGRNLWELKASGRAANPDREVWSTIKEGRVWRGEHVSRRRDGSLFTEETTVTPVRGPDGEISHFIAVQQDVTDRKRMEEQLVQAQKMEAVGRLAGGVAHDFNNLLQAMLGVTVLLNKSEVDRDDAESKLQELEELVRRGSQLTRQLLLFTRRDTTRHELIDLNDVAYASVRMLQRLLRENIDFVFLPANIDLPLIADKGQIEQVVTNLAVNAADAMPRGGRLLLQTGLEAGRAWLEVSDTGEGIPEEIRDRLFEPFFTTKGPGTGTGLGLSVVQGIVHRLGGTIDIDSRMGHGTTVRITFPSADEDDDVETLAAVSEPTANGDGERILLVEDDPAVRASLKEILAAIGYDVTTVGSREETVFLPPAPGFDLLLTDYMLPDGSGTEIAEDLQARWPTMRVVVMSGYARDGLVSIETKLGDLNFLQKPFSTHALAEAVRSALDESSGAHAEDASVTN
jgi:PAS domain S-box-containing protein